jgi:hypothetical protein
MNHRLFKIKEDYIRRKARTVAGGYLIVGLITVGQAEIEVLDVEVQVGQDQLVLDHLPDDPTHKPWLALTDHKMQMCAAST